MPASGRFAGVYVQAISAYAPHPNAAKLWMEYLYSRRGPEHLAKGYCHPIRYDDLVERGVVPGRAGRQAAGLDRRRVPDAWTSSPRPPR